MYYCLSLLACYLLFLATVQGQSSLIAQNATAEALVYGFPLTQFEMLAPKLILTLGANTFYHAPALATSESKAVVKPNVDTLYSSLIYDISQSDVIINVPEVPEDQFHLFSYYDPFGNNFANTGSVNFNQPGQYRIRMRPDTTAMNGLDTNNATPYQAYINSPTAYGTLLIRWLVNSTNLDAIHQYQSQTTAHNETQAEVASGIPSLHLLFAQLLAHQTSNGMTLNTTETTLGLLTAFAPYCPPENASVIESVDNTLAAAGIENGSYTIPAGVDLGAANATATEEAVAPFLRPGVVQDLNHGWGMLAPQFTGNFGIHYAIRATIAKTGYLMLKAPNAIYPTWKNTSTGSAGQGLSGAAQTLGPNEAFIYDFVGGRPLLKPTGFWSLTAYGADNYLIDNPLNVYALGDRGNLTYPDGSSVYGPASTLGNPAHNGSFQILVQPADVPPPANWTNNWLPGPIGGGEMQVLLRFYEGSKKMLDGTYSYPIVSKVAAVTNSSLSSMPSSASGSGSGGSASATASSSSGTSTSGARRVCDSAGRYAVVMLAATLLQLA